MRDSAKLITLQATSHKPHTHTTTKTKQHARAESHPTSGVGWGGVGWGCTGWGVGG